MNEIPTFLRINFYLKLSLNLNETCTIIKLVRNRSEKIYSQSNEHKSTPSSNYGKLLIEEIKNVFTSTTLICNS